jgi:hypothetical protein
MKKPASFLYQTLAGLAALSMGPAMAQAAEPVTAAPQSPGLALASILADETRQIGKIDKLLDALFEQLIASTPEVAVLNETYPGMDKAWKDAMRPILVEEVQRTTPAYHQDLANFFAANLTANEINQIAAFYGSATGQALIDSVSEAVDFKNVASEIAAEVEDEDTDISASSVNKDLKSASTAAVKTMSVKQRQEIARFSLSPAGRKFGKLIPQKQAIDLKWFNQEPSPEAIERIDREIPAALDAHVAKSEAGDAT